MHRPFIPSKKHPSQSSESMANIENHGQLSSLHHQSVTQPADENARNHDQITQREQHEDNLTLAIQNAFVQNLAAAGQTNPDQAPEPAPEMPRAQSESGSIMIAPQTAAQTMSQQTMPKPRQRILKAGKISFGDRLINYDCMVREISKSTAKIKLNDPVAIPDHFYLDIRLDGLRMECERIEQSGLECELRFIGEPQKIYRAQEQKLEMSETALSEAAKQSIERRAHNREGNPVVRRREINSSLVNTFRVRNAGRGADD